MSRKPRTNFAAPLVVTLAALPGCVVRSGPAPAARGGDGAPTTAVSNPPRVTDAPPTPGRGHSRVPVVAPDRITPELVAALKSPTQAVYVALHANHPRELTTDARSACARLVDAGIVMVSQTVLLAGVNDDAATLDALMRAFVETRVKPYYLHHLDRAHGTAHFRTTIAAGQALMRQLRGRLSGLGQPTYVIDLPGGHGKMPIGPGYAEDGSDGTWRITDFRGEAHEYCDCPQ